MAVWRRLSNDNVFNNWHVWKTNERRRPQSRASFIYSGKIKRWFDSWNNAFFSKSFVVSFHELNIFRLVAYTSECWIYSRLWKHFQFVVAPGFCGRWLGHDLRWWHTRETFKCHSDYKKWTGAIKKVGINKLLDYFDENEISYFERR